MAPFDDNREIFGLLRNRGDLQGKDYVCIVAWLLANTDIQSESVCALVKFIFSQCFFPPHSLFNLLILLFQNSERADMGKAMERVTLHLLFKLKSCSEDLVSRLAALLEGAEYKNTLFVNGIFIWDVFRATGLLEVVRFLVDRCHCDLNHRHGEYVLHSVLNSSLESSELEPVVRFLLDRGAHPCVRNNKGVPAFKLFSSAVLPAIGVRTLQCIAASKIKEEKIEFVNRLPKNIHWLLELH